VLLKIPEHQIHEYPLSYSRGFRCIPTDRRAKNGLVVLPQGFETTYKEVSRKIKDENKRIQDAV
jgi:hypothetical protein